MAAWSATSYSDKNKDFDKEVQAVKSAAKVMAKSAAP